MKVSSEPVFSWFRDMAIRMQDRETHPGLTESTLLSQGYTCCSACICRRKMLKYSYLWAFAQDPAVTLTCYHFFHCGSGMKVNLLSKKKGQRK